MSLSFGSEKWTYDAIGECLAGYATADSTYVVFRDSKYEITFFGHDSGLNASIEAKTRTEIEEIFKIVEENLVEIAKAVAVGRKVEKRKVYPSWSITVSGIRALYDHMARTFGTALPRVSQEYTAKHDSEEWVFDSLDAFVAEYTKMKAFDFSIVGPDLATRVVYSDGDLSASAWATRIDDVQALFGIVEAHLQAVQQAAPPAAPKIRVFIGHGRNIQWRELKDHLQDKHGHEVEAYEIGARAGHTIRDILEDMLSKSTIAFLVLTSEDETKAEQFRARQNVIHEVGLFQGKLGFSRAIVLREAGVEGFSNLDGVQYIPFERDNIRATFGDVLAVIRREFGPG